MYLTYIESRRNYTQEFLFKNTTLKFVIFISGQSLEDSTAWLPNCLDTSRDYLIAQELTRDFEREQELFELLKVNVQYIFYGIESIFAHQKHSYIYFFFV